MTEPEKLQLETMAEMWRANGRDLYLKFHEQAPTAAAAVEESWKIPAKQLEDWVKKARIE